MINKQYSMAVVISNISYITSCILFFVIRCFKLFVYMTLYDWNFIDRLFQKLLCGFDLSLAQCLLAEIQHVLHVSALVCILEV